ncbi:MAG: hypothetical protein ACO1N5_13450, partial [Noviherbaspirillum sp.]
MSDATVNNAQRQPGGRPASRDAYSAKDGRSTNNAQAQAGIRESTSVTVLSGQQGVAGQEKARARTRLDALSIHETDPALMEQTIASIEGAGESIEALLAELMRIF